MNIHRVLTTTIYQTRTTYIHSNTVRSFRPVLGHTRVLDGTLRLYLYISRDSNIRLEFSDRECVAVYGGTVNLSYGTLRSARAWRI